MGAVRLILGVEHDYGNSKWSDTNRSGSHIGDTGQIDQELFRVVL